MATGKYQVYMAAEIIGLHKFAYIYFWKCNVMKMFVTGFGGEIHQTVQIFVHNFFGINPLEFNRVDSS